MNLTNLKEWKELSIHKIKIDNTNLRELFKKNKNRFEEFSLKFEDILLDYSKNLITSETMQLLINLASSVNLRDTIEAFFNGEKINISEKRAVLHTALRQSSTEPVYVDGENVIPIIHSELERVANFTDEVHFGKFCGVTSKKFTDIVNIGIGGSDLGPAMVCEALDFYKVSGINSHFVSNVDPSDIKTTLKKLNPETTLFIIASKTFTTLETITNANVAKNWILTKNPGGKINTSEIILHHFVALSANVKACIEFGIAEKNIFKFWDWVGGRYSLWSAIGLSIALAVGSSNFRELLAGAEAIDKHFRMATFEKNIPVILALLGIWYANFFDAKSHCVIPYDQYLKRFPAFLQQLDMESNGKSVQLSGKSIDYATGPIIWGAIGTDSQHSFFQLIHQGSHFIPADFIAFANNLNDNEQHKILLSNYFAQTEALMKGKNRDEVKAELTAAGLFETEISELLPHKIFAGNKPTNSLLIKELTPRSLGSLIAIYEHKVFVQGVIWNINSFDQWGVELGKQLAKKILSELNESEEISSHDSSTNGLISSWKNMQINL